MLVNKDFRFTLNVSTGQYPTKKPTDKVWQIQYSPQEMTAEKLEELEKRGKVFCYNFKEVSESGLVTQTEKTLEGFDYTNALFFDIDKMPVSMTDYISALKFKPTLSYTTYSNGKECEYYKYGYRLVYIFDEPVRSIQEFDNLYYSIAAANGFQSRTHPDGTKYEFDYRKVNQQYFGGGLNSETFRTDNIYSFTDFSSYEYDANKLRNTLSGTDKKYSPNENNKEGRQESKAYYSQLDSVFKNDFFNLPPKEFLFKYEEKYLPRYHQSLSTALIPSPDGRYFTYPDNYQEVRRKWSQRNGKRRIDKHRDGGGRRKHLYVTAQVMRHNLPDITYDEMVFNLVYERLHYYDNSDGILTNKLLLRIAVLAMNRDLNLQDCPHPRFTINREYWASLGITPNQAKNIINKELKESEILFLFDFNLSVKDNLKIMSDNGIKTSRSTLFNLKKKYSPIENNKEVEQENKTYYSHLDFLIANDGNLPKRI